MATKSIKVFFSIGIIFYISLGFYFWFSVDTLRSEAYDTASGITSDLQSEVESAFSVKGSFNSEYFKSAINNFISEKPLISAVLIYDETRGPLYASIKDRRVLEALPGEGWVTGKPDIVLSTPFVKEFTTAVYTVPSSPIYLTAVYNLLDRGRFFPILRNALAAAVLFLILTVLLLSFKPGTPSQDSAAAPPPVVSDVEEKDCGGLYSEKSGLVWERFLEEKLAAELKRAASFDQDSCLVFISITSPSGFIPYRNISELIIEHFSYKDLAFESGDSQFCIIIPDKDIDDGLADVENFKKSILVRFPDSSYKIYAGITSRNSRLLSEKRMIDEARSALTKAESEPVSTTISFRTDLNKYREYIASQV